MTNFRLSINAEGIFSVYKANFSSKFYVLRFTIQIVCGKILVSRYKYICPWYTPEVARFYKYTIILLRQDIFVVIIMFIDIYDLYRTIHIRYVN